MIKYLGLQLGHYQTGIGIVAIVGGISKGNERRSGKKTQLFSTFLIFLTWFMQIDGTLMLYAYKFL